MRDLRPPRITPLFYNRFNKSRLLAKSVQHAASRSFFDCNGGAKLHTVQTDYSVLY